MSLVIENTIRDDVYHTICRHVKANNKRMADYDKNKKSSYLNDGTWIICVDGKCHKSTYAYVHIYVF